jgi:hypothetical protein
MSASVLATVSVVNKLTSHMHTYYCAGHCVALLQGLLNVLDGVVDTPGRIVIMTRYNYFELNL